MTMKSDIPQEKYILIGWPEIQDYMHHPRWNECYLISCRNDQEYLDSTYAVPESLIEDLCTDLKY